MSFREDPETVKRTAAERGYTVFGPPTAYVIDRQGRLIARMVGERKWGSPAVKNLLIEVLKQSAK